MKFFGRRSPWGAIPVLFVACVIGTLSPCSAKEKKHRAMPKPDKGEPTATEAQWKGGPIVGLTIQLDNPTRIESYTFDRAGQVFVMLGAKGGKLATPTYYWELANGQIVVTTEDKQIYDEFTFVSRTSDTLVLRRHNGETVTYKIVAKKVI